MYPSIYLSICTSALGLYTYSACVTSSNILVLFLGYRGHWGLLPFSPWCVLLLHGVSRTKTAQNGAIPHFSRSSNTAALMSIVVNRVFIFTSYQQSVCTEQKT